MAHFLTKALGDFRHYEEQVIWMHEKYHATGKGNDLIQDGVDFSAIARNARSFSRAMAKDMREGTYIVDPAKLVTIIRKNKERVLYKFKLTDMILHGVMSRVLNSKLEPKFSDNLHSYRRGKNFWKAIRSFADYCRAHFKQNINPLEKGFYVLRRDIANYTDNIPTGEDSPLWPLIQKEIDFPTNPDQSDLIAWEYVKKVVRAEVLVNGSLDPTSNKVGVPTGSPISTTMYNLYLINLDRVLDKFNLGFYARYGDDLMMADPDLDKILEANEIFEETLKTYQLSSKKEKENSFFFNIAGREPINPLAKEKGFLGCDRVEFLGCDIMARGQIALHRKKERELTRELAKRVKLGLSNEPLGQEREIIESRLKIAIGIINTAMDPDSKLCQKSAMPLRMLITDRNCLKRLDYNIARMVLQYTLGDSSVRGFRTLRIREMRQKGLISLVHQRNLVGKKKKIQNKETKPQLTYPTKTKSISR